MGPEKGQNESTLVCAARRGDKEALRLLLADNWTWLKGLVYSVVSDGHDVDDVLQDICVRVINKIHTLRQPDRFRPWLAVLARRQAQRHRQRETRRPALLDEELANQLCDGKAQQFFENVERKEQCQQILKAARSLPETYRQVFTIQHSGDFTYEQIAEILDVPVTTVQIRLVRARRMILNRVTEEDRNGVTER
jgi:RNA polymerase sigma-70 factor (ECF subfamily)